MSDWINLIPRTLLERSFYDDATILICLKLPQFFLLGEFIIIKCTNFRVLSRARVEDGLRTFTHTLNRPTIYPCN
jgi:hypothetical protein